MKKYYLNPQTLPDWSNYFSQVTVVEKNGLKMIYLAGQVGVDNDKNLVGSGNLQDQVKQVFINLQTALETVEAKITDIIKMNVYIVNYQPSHAQIIGEVLQQYFTVGQLPVMSLIGVQALAEERFLIEVDAEAVLDNSQST